VVPKRLALLHQLAPSAGEIALLFNPATADPDPPLRDIEAAAATLGLKLNPLPAGSERDLAAAIEAVDRMPGAALLIGNDAFFLGRRKELGELSLRHSVPAAFEHPEFAAAGGLVAYGASLNGEPVAELPVGEPRKFELFVNLETAKALRLTVPAAILGSADELIE
jgi:putative ABC transport system substrate-binding protein